MKHALFSPSQMESILLCPGKFRLCYGVESPTSPYALEGSMAHWIAAKILETGKTKPTKSMISEAQRKYESEVTEELLECVFSYVDLVRYLEKGSEKSALEKKVSLRHLGSFMVYGTVDSIILHKDKITVTDFKYGRVGVPVNKNVQLLIYALGALKYDMQCPTIQLVVFQPRAWLGGEDFIPIQSILSDKMNMSMPRIYTIKRDDLLMWYHEVLKPGMELALTSDAPCIAGEKQCRYCLAKGTCKVFYESNMVKLASVVLKSGLLSYDKDNITSQELGEVYPKLKGLKKWIEAVEKEVHRRLSKGIEVDGYKLVEGRGRRKWVTEDLAKSYFVSNGLGEYLVAMSPAQAEKIADDDTKAKMEQFIKIDNGSPVVAPVTDRRTAVNLTEKGA